MRWSRAAWGSLAAAALLHMGVTVWLRDALAALDPRAAGIERMQAAFTRTIELSEASAGAAPAAPERSGPGLAAARASARAEAASAAAAARVRRERLKREAAARQAAAAAGEATLVTALAASAATTLPDPEPTRAPADLAQRPITEPAPMLSANAVPAAAPPEPAPQAASAPPTIVGTASPAASAPIGPAFAWPASTRLEYKLKGWYRGEVEGSARVEWLREGDRYQTHLEVFIGPSFAPLVTRRMSSEGLVTPQGLVPRRYEQVTKQVFGAPRIARMQFDADGITLAGGRRVPPLADVQDTASQFIQMIYLFSTQPGLRAAGRSVDIGLALPNRADRWVYEVGPLAVQDTPAGQLEAFHVRPRRAAAAGDLSVEIWYAPRLSMLPVRFRIRQDAETYVDLFLDHAPVQAGP